MAADRVYISGKIFTVNENDEGAESRSRELRWGARDSSSNILNCRC